MRKVLHRLGSAVLILSMVGTSVSMPANVFQPETTVHAEVAENKDVQKVSDIMQVKVDDKAVTDLQLYYNGVYETKVQLEAGTHQIQLLKNNGTYQTKKSITVEDTTDVFVRVKDGVVVDSVNNKDQFHTAAFVGNFEAITFLDESDNPYKIDKWNPADTNADLAYLGGGIFVKTFHFEALDEAIELPDGGYKVALDDAWNVSYGNGSDNIALTLPAGANKLTVFVDTFSGKVYDSVRSGIYNVNQNSGNLEFPAFDLNVSLIGTVRCDESANWSPDKTGYEFRQLTDSLYIYETKLSKGTYSYKTVFNYAKWYEFATGDKGFSLSEDSKVVFLYDANTQALYDSVKDEDMVAQMLNMKAAEAVSKVQDNANGTTTFITTQANEGDTVQLVYAPKSNVTETTTVSLKEGTNSKGKFNGTFVSDSIYFGDDALDYVFYYEINGKRVLDDVASVVTVDEETYSEYKRDAFTGRLITVPGTFPGPSWNAASNSMEYCGNGLYQYTFANVPAGNYEFKIATGTWDENYGVDGIASGANYAVSVPKKQDITVYYTDLTTHRAVTSLSYQFAEISLTGDGVNTKLEDPGLTGIFKATVTLEAGIYSNLVMSYGGKEKKVDTITLSEAKDVTFFFDPATEIFYNDSTKVAVNKDAVKFDSKDTAYKSVYGAVEEGQDVTFSIDTGKDATHAQLIVVGAETKNYEMTLADKGDYATWSTKVSFDTYGQYTYFFAVYFGSYVQIYCDDDGYYGTGKLTDLSDLKAYDIVVYKKGYKTPDWMKNAVVYQIFPDRFFNADTDNDKAQVSSRGAVDYEFPNDWYTLPENPYQEENNPDGYPADAFKGDKNWNNEMYGGDLEGITERIEYLKALGVNVIYLNPVFSSISSHRYDATDYRKIDPILGDLGDFKELVNVAEENNMHIVLDGVFNHVSDDSIYFDRYYKFVGENGKVGAYPYWAYVYDYMNENKDATKAQAEEKAKSYFKSMGVTDFSYTEWFLINPTFMKDEKGEDVKDTIGDRRDLPVYSYEGWWGYDSMPVIMSTEGSEYQTGNWADQIIDGEDCVTKYWISQGSNGWRLDVANEVSDETWQHFRQSVKSLDSDAVIIGEIWDDATEYILGDMYDSVMNYMFRNAVLDFAKGGSAKDSQKQLEKLRERYPREAFYAMMNLVGSHDTTRLLSFLDGVDDDRKQTDVAHAFPTYENTSSDAKQSQYLVAMIQMTYPGAPTIYYGDELGMTGADDPDNRRGMIWGEGNKELVEWYAKLANIRGKYAALRTGEIIPLSFEEKEIMSYIRSDKEDTLFVITNNAADDKKVTFVLPEEYKEVGKTLTDLVSGDTFTVEDGSVTVTVPSRRGVILTRNVKEIHMNYEGLKPGYDASYIVKAEQEKPAPTKIPEPSALPKPSVTPEPSALPKPSAKPVKKAQVIRVAASSYKKEVGCKPFSLGAKAKGTLTYRSSNSSVASVSKKGIVTVKAVGKATITITAAETKTYKKAVKTVTVKVVPKKIGCTLKKHYAKKKYSIKVSWKASKKVSGYEVEYATNGKFAGKKVVKAAGNKSSIVIGNVKKRATYYVRIRTFKIVKGVKYYSGYSNVKKMKI